MRTLHLCYPIRQTASDELSWSHYVELLKLARAGSHRRFFNKRFARVCQDCAALHPGLRTDLRLRHGKGFSRANLISMRQFYLLYSKSQKPSGFLSWSHYVELIRMDDPLERGFYEQQAIMSAGQPVGRDEAQRNPGNFYQNYRFNSYLPMNRMYFHIFYIKNISNTWAYSYV